MAKTKIVVGEKYGMLKVVSFSRRTIVDNVYKNYYNCLCDCGKSAEILSYNLLSGNSFSCGCLHTKHSCHSHPIYSNYNQIMQRCYNVESKHYPNYGARGIVLFDEWIDHPDKFIEYVEKELGPKLKGYSIDRKDNDQGYLPGNIRWATPQEQCQNTRRTVLTEDQVKQIFVDYHSNNQTQVEIAEKFGCTKHTVYQIVHRKQWKNITKDLKEKFIPNEHMPTEFLTGEV